MTATVLDTHAWLWWREDPARLSRKATQHLHDPQQPILLSVASIWETAIKLNLGKLKIDRPDLIFDPDHFTCERIDLLPIRLPHLRQVATLAHHHRDPFDRLLIAQCLVERLPIISDDPRLARYGVEVIRAT